jgi:hypothetical protein
MGVMSEARNSVWRHGVDRLWHIVSYSDEASAVCGEALSPAVPPHTFPDEPLEKFCFNCMKLAVQGNVL